jgi:hypothetical protein
MKCLFLKKPRHLSLFVLLAPFSLSLLWENDALAAGRFLISPYASSSSSKAIKPNKSKTAADETVTQRTTYGLKIDIGLFRFLSFQVGVGTNKVDTTRKSKTMRDEFGEIKLEDSNLDLQQDGEYKYKEEQRLATAKFLFSPRIGQMLTLKAGAGVRARQRLLSLSEPEKEDGSPGIQQNIKDPIRYHALASAGLSIRLLKAFSFGAEYNFYFMKFPKIEPHEQEVAISAGVQI